MFSFKIWYSCNLTNFSQNISDYTFNNVETSKFKTYCIEKILKLFWNLLKTFIKTI